MVELPRNVILQGNALDVLKTLPSESVQTVVTSPPYYGLRDYGLPPTIWGGSPDCQHEWEAWKESHEEREERIAGKTRTTDRFYGNGSRRNDGNHQKHSAGAFCQRCRAWKGCLGLEPTPALYVEHLVLIFQEVRRVLRKDGTLWLNLGDSYGRTGTPYPEQGKTGQRADRAFTVSGIPANGQQDKQMLGIPWRVAFALQDAGYILRSDVIWAKPNAMPESVTDRPAKAHEYLFLLSKRERYYYDAEAIREDSSPTSRGNRKAFRGGGTYTGGRSFDNSQPHLNLVTGNDEAPSGHHKRTIWTVATTPFPEAHFATFPQALVEPCVLAGSAPCVCETCGASWRRIIERSGGTWEERKEKGAPARYGLHGAKGIPGGGANRDLGAPVSFTLGWEPTCRCKENTGAGRSVVLDPFSGAGTVALVAAQLGRDYLGIDLNAEYIEMAQRRIRTGGKRAQRELEAAGVEQPTLWAVS